jgi:hypothetical protein
MSILEKIIPVIDIKKTRFGLVGKKRIPTKTRGKLGNKTIPLTKETRI